MTSVATATRPRFVLPTFRSVDWKLGSLSPLMSTALIFVALMPPTLLAMAFDQRSFQGDSVWLKPFKFEVALAVFFATVAFSGQYTSHAFRQARKVRWFIYAACFAALGEIVWIGGAAMFGTASHFNVGSAFMANIYALMGVFAVTLTATSLVVGIGVLRNTDGSLSPVMRDAIGWSMILTFVATIITAGYMSSAGGHLVGPEARRAAHWITGWSTQVGDLRVAHFFATHALHFVPALALGAAYLLPTAAARLIVWVGLAAYAGLVGFTFAHAILGQPFMAS